MVSLHKLLLHYLAAILMLCVVITQARDWRTNPDYEPWTMQGKFLLGTPRACKSPPQPEHGRWVCSYGKGDNGRSLCILDCKKNFIIENRPLIFNCANGDWEMFPTPGTPVEMPWGDCIPVELYKARFNSGALTEKRSEAITERGTLLELEDFIDSL